MSIIIFYFFIKQKELPKSRKLYKFKMAEWVGFEPTHGYPSNDLANRPLQPLEYHSMYKIFMAERVGFEPTVPCGITGFQDQLLKPLGHLSVLRHLVLYQILRSFVNHFSLTKF